jgi:hypothetical protein
MASALIRLSALALLIVVIAGCGGGSSGGAGGGGGNNPTVVTFTVNGPTPTAVAAKIGSGAFAAQTISSGKVSLSIPSGTTEFAVAVKCPPLSQTVGPLTITTSGQTVFEATTADGTEFTIPCSAPVSNPATGALTGSADASAIAGVNTIGVTAGSESYFLTGASSNFNLTAPAGTSRVAVGGYVYTASNPYGADSVYTLAALRNFDGVTVPGTVNGGATVELGAADAVTQEPITYIGLPSNYAAPGVFAFYEWKNGGGVWLTNGAASTYPVVPGAAAETGDFYIFTVSAYSQSHVGEGMVVSASSTSAGPLTFTFPPPWSYAGPAAAAQPSFDVTYAGFAGKAGVTDTAAIGWQTGSGNTTQYSCQVLASANYLNGSTTLVVPDLSGVPGFLPAPVSGTNVAWLAEIIQRSNGFLQPSSTAGNASSVLNGGTFTVP